VSDGAVDGVPGNDNGTSAGTHKPHDPKGPEGREDGASGDGEAAIEAFIRRRGVTRCPTAHARGGRLSVLLGGIYL
jgi:hypothetical protein